MATITVIAAGYEAELDVPDDSQVMDALRYQTMLTTTAELFQIVASNDATDRNNQLTALAALQVAIDAARDAALPALSLTPE